MADLRAFALSAVALAALSSAAFAADLLPPPPAYEPPPPISAPEMGGWYIKGDVGVGVNNIAGAETSPSGISTLGGDAGSETWSNALSESALYDVGVGYQVNNWFRADVTGELRGSAGYSGAQTIVDNVSGYTETDFYKANLSSVLGMVNGYADLGTWYGMTPYVGAGVGVAFNHLYGGQDYGVIIQGPAAGNATSPGGGVFGASTTTNLAWSLMAGLDFTITHNLKLELGYRYLDYGKFTSANANCVQPGGLANCGFKVASKELTSNDFRLGLRYYFDSPAPLPPPEAPLVRKY